MPYSDPFRALAYGPVVGEYGQSQMTGAYDNPLGQYDVALSPDKLKKYPLGSFVTAHDKAGNPIGNYRVADASYYTPGKPTKNTVEFRDADRSGQQVFLSPSATPPPGTGPYQAPPSGPAVPGPMGHGPNLLQTVLANYGVGGPTATPTGMPAPAQPAVNHVADFLKFYYSHLPQQKYPYG